MGGTDVAPLLECAGLTALWIRRPRKCEEIESAVKPAHSKFSARTEVPGRNN